MRKILAIAKNTAKQIFRMKVAFVFILLLLILLPLMGVTMSGDGTLKGKLQTFVSYSLSLTSLLLCLLTIIVSIYSLSSDIQQRQIFTLATKPVKRFQIIIGKFLGVLFVNAVLLVFFSAIIYITAILIPKYTDTSKEELAKVEKEFYTARAGIKPQKKDVTEEVQKTYEKLKKSPDFQQRFEGKPKEQVLRTIRHQKEIEQRSVPSGEQITWEFHDIEPYQADQKIFVRFKYDVSVNPPDLSIYSRWIIGDTRPSNYESQENEVYVVDRKDLIRTFFEIEVPADAIADDGYLGVTFINVPNLNNTTVIFPPKDGLELLYKADEFTPNFIRSILLIFCRLIFLAVLGLFASTFLSFPVAVMLCLSIFCTAMISGFIVDSFRYLGESAGIIYSFTVEPLINLIPRFDTFSPGKYMIPARLIPWSVIGKIFLVMVFFKSLLLLLLSLLIFHRKELAKITV